MRTKSFLKGSSLAERGYCFGVFAARQGSSLDRSVARVAEFATSTSHIGNITGNAKAAAATYRRYCVGCHENLGDGNGEVAQWLQPPMWPKPRDFQLGISVPLPRQLVPCPPMKISMTRLPAG